MTDWSYSGWKQTYLSEQSLACKAAVVVLFVAHQDDVQVLHFQYKFISVDHTSTYNEPVNIVNLHSTIRTADGYALLTFNIFVIHPVNMVNPNSVHFKKKNILKKSHVTDYGLRSPNFCWINLWNQFQNDMLASHGN